MNTIHDNNNNNINCKYNQVFQKSDWLLW